MVKNSVTVLAERAFEKAPLPRHERQPVAGVAALPDYQPFEEIKKGCLFHRYSALR